MKKVALLLILSTVCLVHAQSPIDKLVKAKPDQKFSVSKTDDQWRQELPRLTYLVLRQAGTEKPYSGKYWDFHESGVFACAACGQVLFSSRDKFDSHTGWPSFLREIASGRTLARADHSGGMDRTEIICARCGGHLGHVFDDGPEPTGLRYCMNSPALKFIPSKKGK